MNLKKNSVDRGINQTSRKLALRIVAEFTVNFSFETSINRKNIIFICNHLIVNTFQDSKHSYEPLLRYVNPQLSCIKVLLHACEVFFRYQA